jgi:hypothetical protein
MEAHKIVIDILEQTANATATVSLEKGEYIIMYIPVGESRYEPLRFQLDGKHTIKLNASNTLIKGHRLYVTEVNEEVAYELKKGANRRKMNIADVIFGRQEIECILLIRGYLEYKVKINPYSKSKTQSEAKNTNVEVPSTLGERVNDSLKFLRNGG